MIIKRKIKKTVVLGFPSAILLNTLVLKYLFVQLKLQHLPIITIHKKGVLRKYAR